MDYTKILSEDEWVELLNHEMQKVNITETEKRQLAKTLVYHFMTIGDVLQLTLEQLVSFLNHIYFYFLCF